MASDQPEHALWWSLPHRETAQSIDHVVTPLGGLEQAHRAFKPKDLLDAFPLLSKPVTQVRTTGHLAVFHPSMPLRPRSPLESFGDDRACDPQTDRQYPQ